MSRAVALVLTLAAAGCGGKAPAPSGNGGGRPAPPRAAKTAEPAAEAPAPAEAQEPGAAPAARRPLRGQAALDAFEAWYTAHPGDFDAARARLRDIMEASGGTDFAGFARMRLKEVERDRERAASDWFAAAERRADARLGAGDLAGALAVVADVPEAFRKTSFGAQAADWPRHLAKKVHAELSLRGHRADEALKAGDPAAARTESDAVRRVGAGARDAFAPAIAAEIAAAAETLAARVEARATAIERQRRWEADEGAALADARAKLGAGDAAAAWESAKGLRARIGPPDPGETGIRRDAEELWIAAATKATGYGTGFAPGVAQKTPDGARLRYDFQDAAQLADWETAAPPAVIADGLLQLPAGAVAVHRAKFLRRVTLRCQALPGAVVACAFGQRLRVAAWMGRLVTVTYGDAILATHDQKSSPATLTNPATLTIVRDGATISVAWDGIEVVRATADPAPPDAECATVAFTGGPRGSGLLAVTIEGDPDAVPAPAAAPETPAAPDTPAASDKPPAPHSTQSLRPRPPGLGGWTASGPGKWSPVDGTDILCEGGRKRDQIATLIHELPDKYAFSEYEFACEMRFAKHRDGSTAGLIFPVGAHHCVWLFDDDVDGGELLGASGVSPRGSLMTGPQAWLAVKVKVKDGKATGFIGKNKSWEFEIAATTLTTPARLPATGVGLASRGGAAAVRNPAIRFFK